MLRAALIGSILFTARSKMGFVESGSFYLHKVRRHPQEPGSAHIQSQVGQPGPVDPGANPGTVTLPFIWALNGHIGSILVVCHKLVYYFGEK